MSSGTRETTRSNDILLLVQLKGSTSSRDLGDSRPESQPVYSALTFVTPGRATVKRCLPISHPGDTHRTTERTYARASFNLRQISNVRNSSLPLLLLHSSSWLMFGHPEDGIVSIVLHRKGKTAYR